MTKYQKWWSNNFCLTWRDQSLSQTPSPKMKTHCVSFYSFSFFKLLSWHDFWKKIIWYHVKSYLVVKNTLLPVSLKKENKYRSIFSETISDVWCSPKALFYCNLTIYHLSSADKQVCGGNCQYVGASEKRKPAPCSLNVIKCKTFWPPGPSSGKPKGVEAPLDRNAAHLIKFFCKYRTVCRFPLLLTTMFFYSHAPVHCVVESVHWPFQCCSGASDVDSRRPGRDSVCSVHCLRFNNIVSNVSLHKKQTAILFVGVLGPGDILAYHYIYISKSQ